MKHFRSQHRPKKSSLLVGKTAIMEALAAGKTIDRLYLQANGYKDLLGEMRGVAQQHGFPVNYVPVEKLNSFNAGEHGGVIAMISKVVYHDLQQTISWVVDKGKSPLLLILDGITDVRNIGAIARTAYATGVHALIIPDKGVGALNEDAVQTSAGALEKITVCRVPSLMKAVDELHLNGITVLASEMTAEKDIASLDLQVPVAIVLGSEDKGINPALMKICDTSFHIPMQGGFESLNVSVATGMILYEAMRQRAKG